MKSSQAPGGPGEQEQPSPFAGLTAYPEHEEGASSSVPGYGDVPPPGYGPAVMRYEITQNKLLEKGRFSIFDDSGTLRFTVPGNWSICDPSGGELAAADRHPFRRQVDILRNGWAVASVHAIGLGPKGEFRIDGPAGQFAAIGEFFSHNYTLTGPGGDTVATVAQQSRFPERLDVEIAPGQDDVLLLAVILAIEDIRDRPDTGTY
jgi:uncharacterized protein YxjI